MLSTFDDKRWTNDYRNMLEGLLINETNVPRHHAKMRPENIDSKEWFEKFYFLRDYSINRGSYIFAIVGDRGRGKTQLSVSLMKYEFYNFFEESAPYRGADPNLISKWGWYITADEMIFDHTQSTQKPTDYLELHYLNTDMLIIDGFENRKYSDFELRILNRIIDSRYREKKKTILAANQTYELFLQSVGASIVDRITEKGGVIECTWNDFRLNKTPEEPIIAKPQEKNEEEEKPWDEKTPEEKAEYLEDCEKIFAWARSNLKKINNI